MRIVRQITIKLNNLFFDDIFASCVANTKLRGYYHGVYA